MCGSILPAAYLLAFLHRSIEIGLNHSFPSVSTSFFDLACPLLVRGVLSSFGVIFYLTDTVFHQRLSCLQIFVWGSLLHSTAASSPGPTLCLQSSRPASSYFRSHWLRLPYFCNCPTPSDIRLRLQNYLRSVSVTSILAARRRCFSAQHIPSLPPPQCRVPNSPAQTNQTLEPHLLSMSVRPRLFQGSLPLLWKPLPSTRRSRP